MSSVNANCFRRRPRRSRSPSLLLQKNAACPRWPHRKTAQLPPTRKVRNCSVSHHHLRFQINPWARPLTSPCYNRCCYTTRSFPFSWSPECWPNLTFLPSLIIQFQFILNKPRIFHFIQFNLQLVFHSVQSSNLSSYIDLSLLFPFYQHCLKQFSCPAWLFFPGRQISTTTWTTHPLHLRAFWLYIPNFHVSPCHIVRSVCRLSDPRSLSYFYLKTLAHRFKPASHLVFSPFPFSYFLTKFIHQSIYFCRTFLPSKRRLYFPGGSPVDPRNKSFESWFITLPDNKMTRELVICMLITVFQVEIKETWLVKRTRKSKPRLRSVRVQQDKKETPWVIRGKAFFEIQGFRDSQWMAAWTVTLISCVSNRRRRRLKKLLKTRLLLRTRRRWPRWTHWRCDRTIKSPFRKNLLFFYL